MSDAHQTQTNSKTIKTNSSNLLKFSIVILESPRLMMKLTMEDLRLFRKVKRKMKKIKKRKESMYSVMELCTRVSGKAILDTGMVSSNGQTELAMKDSGKKTKLMAKESFTT